MADDLDKRGPDDRARIALGEPHEMAYWTRHLGVSMAQLQQAVDAVGNATEQVRQHLARQQRGHQQ